MLIHSVIASQASLISYLRNILYTQGVKTLLLLFINKHYPCSAASHGPLFTYLNREYGKKTIFRSRDECVTKRHVKVLLSPFTAPWPLRSCCLMSPYISSSSPVFLHHLLTSPPRLPTAARWWCVRGLSDPKFLPNVLNMERTPVK